MTSPMPAEDIEGRATRPDVTLSPEAVEGRLLAQRKVLALILRQMLQQEGGRDLRDRLDSLSVMQDHQEDPGAVLRGAEVIQTAIAVEVREIVLAASRAQLGNNG